MERVNIYLDDEQLGALRALSARRNEPVAALVREAIDDWLKEQGVRRLSPDEWAKRFDDLLRRRRGIARKREFEESDVERDVMAAVRGSRKARAARRR